MSKKSIGNEAEHTKEQMLRKAKKINLQFGSKAHNPMEDSDVVVIEKRSLSTDKAGRLTLKGKKVSIWFSVLFFGLSVLVTPVVFQSRATAGQRIGAIALFLVLQGSSILMVNAVRPTTKIFDKTRKRYWIQRPNHLFTRPFRKSRTDKKDLKSARSISVTSFMAKRWKIEYTGTGENQHRRRYLVQYENYRVSLNFSHDDSYTVYDWYELDHALEVGQGIADYLEIPFKLS